MPVATAASPTLSAASAGSYLRASPANVSIKAIEIYVPNTVSFYTSLPLLTVF